MKTMKILIFCVSLISILGCDKNESEDLKNLDVEKYVEQLKKGEYESFDLPVFTYRDIPALLEYRNETQIITDYPHNGISSLGMPECALGMYILWTIESIRSIAIDSEYLIGRFPSQNPILAYRDSLELDLVSDNESHIIVAKAYFDWWENNRNKEFDDFKNIDPIDDTDYKWH
jgi:hypothetical protein